MRKNTAGMIANRRANSLRKRELVLSLIKRMAANNEPISVHGLAQRAEVTRNFIYAHSELIEEVKRHRIKADGNEISVARKQHDKSSASYKSIESKYQTVLGRNKALLEENVSLKERVKALQAHIEFLESHSDKLAHLHN